MNKFEIILTPLYIAPNPETIIPAFDIEKIIVEGETIDVVVYSYDTEHLAIKKGKEIVYLVPMHMVRSCRKLLPKKSAKVLHAIADKK